MLKTVDLPVPGFGQWVEVVNGVCWLRMPMPFALDHINLYLLEDGDGWYLVDTGLFTSSTCELWQRLLGEGVAGKPLKGILVTHHHPDHLGCAGWLQQQVPVPVWLSEPAYKAAQRSWLMKEDVGLEPQRSFFRRAGVGAAEQAGLLRVLPGLADYYSPLPGAPLFLEVGQDVLIGGQRWQVRISNGHAPGHVSLHCESLGVLISGDQLLPQISPNVSVSANDPDGNPLADWMASLSTLTCLSDDTLVLPSHNAPFRGLHQRVDELLTEHSATLERLRSLCTQPYTAASLASQLYPYATLAVDRMLAIGETLAHLHYLLELDELERLDDGADGTVFQQRRGRYLPR